MDYFAPPENLYGLAIAEPLQLDRIADGDLIFFTEYIRILLLLLFTFITQCTLMKKLANIIGENSADVDYSFRCNDNLITLQCACVFVFMIALFGDIRECVDMFHGIMYCRPGSYSALQQVTHIEHVGILHQENQHEQGAILSKESPKDEGVFQRMKGWFKRKKEHPDQWNLDRLTFNGKVMIVLVVIAPKMLVGCVLFFIGAEYILASPDVESMVLNTLAVLFIIEIDEYLYHSFTSSTVKSRLATMRASEVELTNNQRVTGFVFSNFIAPPFMITMMFVLVQYNRRHC